MDFAVCGATMPDAWYVTSQAQLLRMFHLDLGSGGSLA